MPLLAELDAERLVPLAPVAICGEAVFEFMRNKFAVVVDEAGFDLRRDAVPVAIDIGGETDFGGSRAAQVAFADGASQRFDIAALCGRRGFIHSAA